MWKFWLNSPLFEEAPAGDGTGGTGGGSGAGAGNSGAFDPIAFKNELKTELLGDIRKDLNGISKGLTKDLSKMIEGLRPAANAGSAAGSGEGAGAGGGEGAGGKAVTPEVNALQLELKKLRETYDGRVKSLEDAKSASEKKAEEMSLDGALRDVLGEFEFVTPEAQKTAMQIFKPLIQRDEDGSLIAGDLPLKKYIESELPAKHAYLVKAKDVGGAGARSGKASSGGRRWDTTETLKPENYAKLTPQEKTEFRQHLAKMA